MPPSHPVGSSSLPDDLTSQKQSLAAPRQVVKTMSLEPIAAASREDIPIYRSTSYNTLDVGQKPFDSFFDFKSESQTNIVDDSQQQETTKPTEKQRTRKESKLRIFLATAIFSGLQFGWALRKYLACHMLNFSQQKLPY